MPGRGEGKLRGVEHNMHAEEEEKDSGKEGWTCKSQGHVGRIRSVCE